MFSSKTVRLVVTHCSRRSYSAKASWRVLAPSSTSQPHSQRTASPSTSQQANALWEAQQANSRLCTAAGRTPTAAELAQQRKHKYSDEKDERSSVNEKDMREEREEREESGFGKRVPGWTSIRVEDPYPLRDMVVMVTGASSGIGEATAKHLGCLGAHVVLTARRTDAIESLARLINESDSPGSASAYTMDVTNEEQTRRVIQLVVERHGRLDGAFNNAGTTAESTTALQSSSRALDDTFAVNLRGLWICMQEQLKCMFESKSTGAIVNCSSMYSQGAVPLAPLYAASKAAVDSLTASFAVLAAPRGITVNSVRPGPTVPSELLEQFAAQMDPTSPEAGLAAMAASVPRQHMVAAVQIAHQVAYFLHPLSNMITGQAVPVCGGDSTRFYTVAGLTAAQIADIQLVKE